MQQQRAAGGATPGLIGMIRGGARKAREDIAITAGALRQGGQLRKLLLAEGQSAIGDAAADVALLLVAYQRLHSPWALSAVLLADRFPRVVLAPLAGVLADRVSRRACLIAADVMRASALLAIVLVHSFVLTVVLAGVLGCGTALYRPVVEAALPTVAAGSRDGAARAVTARWTVISVGELIGWGAAAAMLLAVSPSSVLLVDAASFVVSISIVARLTVLDRPRDGPDTTLNVREGLQMLQEGARATREIPGIMVLFVTVLSAILAGGLMNVGDPLLAKNTLHSGDAGFGALKAAIGIGLLLGTALSGPRERGVALMRRSYFRALAVAAVGAGTMAGAPTLTVAMLGSVLLGAGNGLAVTRHLQLIQLTVPEGLIGRINGLLNAAEAGAFVLAFLLGGAGVVLLGVRGTFVISAAGLVLAAVLGYMRMRAIERNEAGPARGPQLDAAVAPPVDPGEHPARPFGH